MMKTTNDYCVADEVMKKLEEMKETSKTILELSNSLFSGFPTAEEGKQRPGALDFGMYTIDELSDITSILQTSVFKLSNYIGNSKFNLPGNKK